MIQKAETDLCISTGLIDDDLFRWRICFQGPEGSPFEGGLYEATLTFPDDFPHMPPKMIFKTEMFHPNSKIIFYKLQSIQQEKYVSQFCIHHLRIQ